MSRIDRRTYPRIRLAPGASLAGCASDNSVATTSTTPLSTLPATPVSPPSTLPLASLFPGKADPAGLTLPGELPPTRTPQGKWGLPTLTKRDSASTSLFDVPVLATPRPGLRKLTAAEENQGHAQMPRGPLATSGNSLNCLRQSRAGIS